MTCYNTLIGRLQVARGYRGFERLPGVKVVTSALQGPALFVRCVGTLVRLHWCLTPRLAVAVAQGDGCVNIVNYCMQGQ